MPPNNGSRFTNLVESAILLDELSADERLELLPRRTEGRFRSHDAIPS